MTDLTITLLILAAAVVAYRLFDVVALRVDIWLNPWPTAQGQAYQIVQSLLAIAEGGLFGGCGCACGGEATPKAPIAP